MKAARLILRAGLLLGILSKFTQTGMGQSNTEVWNGAQLLGLVSNVKVIFRTTLKASMLLKAGENLGGRSCKQRRRNSRLLSPDRPSMFSKIS